MSRPRRDSEILPAKERLENSFWALLAEEPFARITVTDVVHDADVNRNSFYYHFSDLSELADSAILHEVERMPSLPFDEVGSDPELAWRRHAAQLIGDPEHRQCIDRLSLLIGEHGCDELAESLHDFIVLSIMSRLHLNGEDVSPKTALIMDFFVGGILSVLHQWPAMRGRLAAEDLMGDDITVLMVGVYLTLSNGNAGPYRRRLLGGTPQP